MQRIFVSIAGIRDGGCRGSVENMFANATHPERVFAGVCRRIIPADDDAPFVVDARAEQVRAVTLRTGACQPIGWGRWEARKLWQGEEYWLQTDAHARFAKGWDERLIALLSDCPSPNAILTSGHFGNGTLQPVALASSGFLFAPGRVLEQVAADPAICANDEDATVSARLWTHGWDLFAINEEAPGHDDDALRQDRLCWMEEPPAFELAIASARRAMHLLEKRTTDDARALKGLGQFGLGQARSLADYQRHAAATTGPSVEKRRITVNAKSFVINNKQFAKWWDMVDSGTWEPETFQLFDQFIEEGSVFIDIGAWIGATVLYGALSAGEVHAFECDPSVIGILKTNLSLNPALAAKVTVHKAAFGAFDGTAPLFNDMPGNSGTSLMQNFGYTGNVKQKHFADARVLDGRAFLEGLDMEHVSLIKIDVEGAEYDLIPHIAPLLAEYRPNLHLSLHPMNIGGFEDDDADRRQRIEKTAALLDCLKGYRHVYLESGGAVARHNSAAAIFEATETAANGCAPHTFAAFSDN